MKPFWLALALSGSMISTFVASGQEKDPPKAKIDMQALVDGNNEFAFDLYARLSKQQGNIVFSPYSISSALAMTYGGARGDTAQQMARVLHFTLPPATLHSTCGALIADLQKDEEHRPFHLCVANALWGQKDYAFRKEFLGLTVKSYGAHLKEVDFSRHPDEARKVINQWVEANTRNQIKELLKTNDVTSNSRLVLTNAIYFKATWLYQFSKENTKDGVFEVSSSRKVTVPMMNHKEQHFKYFSSGDFQWLELPYKGERNSLELPHKGKWISMVLLLPQKKGRLADLEKMLTSAVISQGIEKLKNKPGTVSVPRFKATCRFDLAGKFAEMGMPLAFGPAADFSGIAPGITIGRVIHEAFIDVDEVGTEAAAATATETNESSVPPFSFRADHPFFFLIRDMQTGSVLFQGRVADPTLDRIR